MNGFQLHNQQHTSASSINMWADCPHAWVAQYLFGMKSEFGAAPKAGMLVEDAVTNIIARGFTEEDAIKSALLEYNKFISLSATDSDRKRGDAIPDMIKLAVHSLKQYGEPEFADGGKQKKIEVMCNGDGWSLPIVGYIDFHFPKYGVIVDLKSTMKMPSKLSDAHRRQACIYRHAMGNQGVSFLYVTGKKAEFLECPDTRETLSEIKAILNQKERFLRLGDRDFIKSVVPIVTGSFYHDATIAKELYGI